MTPAELREAIDGLPLTQAQIAERIGVSYGHLRNALSGKPLCGEPCVYCGQSPETKLRELMEENQ